MRLCCVPFATLMELPWKRKKDDISEEELLAEIEKESAELRGAPMPPQMGGQRPPMPPPMIQKPVSSMPLPTGKPMPAAPQGAKPMLPPPPPIFPMADSEKPALTDQQVAKLPLFMKIEEYDRIVADLNTLVSALEKMESILENLNKLEEGQRAETENWREQLGITRDLLKRMLVRMPETGRLKNIVEERKKIEQKDKFTREVSDLQKDLKKVSSSKKPTEQISAEIHALHSNIGSIQDDMRALHEELKSLAEVAKQKAAEEQARRITPHNFPRPPYQRTETKKPW